MICSRSNEIDILTYLDGNGVELYWDRPKDEWPRADDGSLGMFTQPLDVRALLAETE